MSLVTCQLSVSLDGLVAGPNQSAENPLGKGGMRLHEWAFAARSGRREGSPALTSGSSPRCSRGWAPT